ncbi:MAG: thioredoxin [Candidatus Desulfofervidus auxilii]|nr:thioredoxin [Candidatus Desulfofervidus auxilii]
MAIIVLTDANFNDEVLNSNLPVIVDFWAPWCAPCRMIAPIMEELATQYENKVKICKINVDENPITPGRFEIKAIPTIIFFKNGKVYDQIVGVVPKSMIEQIIEKMLA